jgi:hypothetical protein
MDSGFSIIQNKAWSKITLGDDVNLYIGSIDVSKDDDFYVGTYGSSVWVGTSHFNSVVPSTNTNNLKLFPNPSNGIIHIDLQTTELGRTQLGVMNLLGQKVATISDGELNPGTHSFDFNTGNLSTGSYFLLLQTPGVRKLERVDVEK